VLRAGDEIENPLTGERIVFLQTAADTDGELLEMDDFWGRPGHRAAEHVHPQMQERWELIAGSARFRIAGEEQTAQSGDVVLAPPGVPHLAWNPGVEPVHLRIQMRPALRWEDFVVGLFGLAQSAHLKGLAAPEPGAMTELLSQFRAEIRLP
jgi:quercetin dioxygenase-like cupin family protein